MIYIFLGILVALNLLIVIIDKNAAKLYNTIEYDVNEKLYKESMDSYDLKDPEQLGYYVDDKNYYDTLILAKQYDSFSPEHYYISTEIRSTIECLNQNECSLFEYDLTEFHHYFRHTNRYPFVLPYGYTRLNRHFARNIGSILR